MTDLNTWVERITEHSGMERAEIKEAAEYGADTGWPGFSYTRDAADFTAKYRDDVWEMLAEDAETFGAESVAAFVAGFSRADMADSPDRFDNLLAWYVLESVGRMLADEVATHVCRHCQRGIVEVAGIWVDPEASGDDSIWRETCESHDTFAAEHEPVES